MKNAEMIRLRGYKSQRVVAQELQIPISTYAMIELGKRFPRPELQFRLANYFGVTVDQLFFTRNGHEMCPNNIVNSTS